MVTVILRYLDFIFIVCDAIIMTRAGFSTWGTRVICDTLTLKIVTLRLYFYVTLLIQKYKENDTKAEKSRTYSRTLLTSDYSLHFRTGTLKLR